MRAGNGALAGASIPRLARDLPVRVASAAVLLALFAVALWHGGVAFTALVALFAALALFEWLRIARKMDVGAASQIGWIIFGIVYIGAAGATILLFRRIGLPHAMLPIMATVFTDTGAYFAGRTIGGPKIAPSISPSKTWAGLLGGMVAAGVFTAWWNGQYAYHGNWTAGVLGAGLAGGAILAIVAQIGDFLESWMKRRAGLKDSGALIPGHGGVLDRVDGMLAVLCACGIGWLMLNLFVE